MKILFSFLMLAFLAEISAMKRVTKIEVDHFSGKIFRITTVEDHPWVIVNDTCMQQQEDNTNSCFSGLLIKIVNLIQQDLKFNYTIEKFKTFGNLDKIKNPPEWTDLIGSITTNKSDIALAAFNTTGEIKEIVDLSTPFINDKTKNKTLALAFPKGSPLNAGFSHMIKKLINQRYIEQLKIMYTEEKDLWSKDKQITQFP